ncbi:hypothetical protein [Halovulum sp. GXIMD14793]
MTEPKRPLLHRLLRKKPSTYGPQWPKETPQDEHARLPNLAERFRRRRGLRKKLGNMMPPLDVDFAPYFVEVQAPPDHIPEGPRSKMAVNSARLKKQLAGQPQIVYFHALFVSYLRRNSAHTDHARRLFFRLWQDHGTELMPLLDNRWLISALQTFHDHGLNEHQRRIGSVGWVYANLLKFAEAERSYCDMDPKETYPGQIINRMGFPHCGAASLDQTDAMLNTNALVYELAFLDPVAGPLLEELLVRVRNANTLFWRMDATRAKLGLLPEKYKNYGCFAEPYPGSDQASKASSD